MATANAKNSSPESLKTGDKEVEEEKISGGFNRKQLLQEAHVPSVRNLAKNIILLFDGTSNAYDVIGYKTNIVILLDLLQRAKAENRGINNNPLHVKYFPGIATSRNPVDDLLDNMNAFTLDEKIIEAYVHLTDVYNEGDSIYFFGFSRGAYTARCLSGFIRRYGILGPSVLDKRTIAEQNLQQFKKENKACKRFRGQLKHVVLRNIANVPPKHNQDIMIHYMGLFDTVMGPHQKKRDEFQYDTFCDQNFIIRSCHIMAKRTNAVYFPLSYLVRDDRGKNQCANTSSSSPYWEFRAGNGDHCDIGGGWIPDPYDTPCLANYHLRQMIKHFWPELLEVIKTGELPIDELCVEHSIFCKDDMEKYTLRRSVYKVLNTFRSCPRPVDLDHPRDHRAGDDT